MDVTITRSPSSQPIVLNPNEVLSETSKADDDIAKVALLQQFKQQIKGKRGHRKRRHSIAEDATSDQSLVAKTCAAKHRRQYSTHSKKGYAGDIILPTNFLLGGNISDPLNLKSLLDENVNRALNAVTPSSSPLPPRSSKISIVIPNDMTDPLGLNLVQTANKPQEDNQDKDASAERQVKSNHKKKRKRRKSLHEKMFTDPQPEPETKEEDAQIKPRLISSNNQKENVKSAKNRKSNSKLLNIEDDSKASEDLPVPHLTITLPKVSSAIVDPIVSPVVPQDVKRSSIIFSPKSKKRKSLSQGPGKKSSLITSNYDSDKSPGNNTQNEKSRNDTINNSLSEQLLSEISAARLHTSLKSQISIPHEKKQTLKQTKNFKPENARFQFGNYTKYYGYRNPGKFQDVRINCLKKEWFKDKDVLDVGCNVGHFTLLIARDFSPRKVVGIDIDESLIRCARKNVRHYATAQTNISSSKNSKYPDSMSVLYGPIIGPPLATAKDDEVNFPNNVVFLQGNYVPEKDEVLQCQEPEYDVILCLSVTKWVHLNWGDEGLMKTFKRFYKQLRPGGKLILEPQEWRSYAKKKSKLTETIYNNYFSIKLKPESFPRYLINEVGFEKVEILQFSETQKAKGFQRPIQLYHKPE